MSYPWPKPTRITRCEAPGLYCLEEKQREINDKLVEMVTPILEHHRGRDMNEWRDTRPYITFCYLEGQDTEASIAACLGYLSWVIQEDNKLGMDRESISGLILPQEPRS